MENIYDLENLSRVWEKVTSVNEETAPFASARSGPEPVAACPDPVTGLRAFLDGEFEDATVYSSLAQRSRSPYTQRIFRKIANDKKQHIKRLTTEHFILSGDIYAPKAAGREQEGVMSAIRRMYLKEAETAAAYLAAAAKETCTHLSETYSHIAAGRKSHADILLSLIERFMN